MKQKNNPASELAHRRWDKKTDKEREEIMKKVRAGKVKKMKSPKSHIK